MSSSTGTQSAVTRQSVVTLREITHDTLREITNLRVREEQRQFVADNALSVAEAYFVRDNAWFRGIYASDTPVGFVMLYEVPERAHYYLWRYMIDARYQGMGFGLRALQQVIERVKTLPGAKEMKLSYWPADGNPGPFYRKLGFQDTGEVDDGENVMKLAFGAAE